MKRSKFKFFGSNSDKSDSLIGKWILTQAMRLEDEEWLPVEDKYIALKCLTFLSDNVFIEYAENANKEEMKNWGRYIMVGNSLSFAYIEEGGAIAKDNAYMSTIVEHTSTELIIQTATCLPRQIFMLHFKSSNKEFDPTM